MSDQRPIGLTVEKANAIMANNKTNVGNETVIDKDPNGIEQHTPGAKLDAGKNRLGLVLGSFSRALKEVGKVGTFGANKYTPHGWEKVIDGIERYTDADFRHLFDEMSGEEIDKESQMLHAAQHAWNALARLELILREKENKKNGKNELPKGPGKWNLNFNDLISMHERWLRDSRDNGGIS